MSRLRSKTMWFSMLLVIFGAFLEYSDYLKQLVDPKYFPSVMIGIGIVVGILRELTKVPVRDR